MDIADLAVRGVVVARIHDGSSMPDVLSPRPYLEATTLSGAEVTTVQPADHPHHHGVSVAIPDVDGVSYWGGRTFVPGSGSTMLDNHGVQRIEERRADAQGVTDRLVWLRPDGSVQLTERRTIRVAPVDAGWVLEWDSRLTAEAEFSIGSPATNGREGAFYGGIFWRTPFDSASVLSQDGAGVGVSHGSHSPWLAVEAPHATLVAWAPPGFPWFVRDEGYVGFCPAVAVDQRRVTSPGMTLRLRLSVAVLEPGADVGATVRQLEEWEGSL